MTTEQAAHSLRFRLAVSAEDYLPYYAGKLRDIIVRAEDNRRIRFPASAIRGFLTMDGIHGQFEIQFDGSNKLICVKQIGP